MSADQPTRRADRADDIAPPDATHRCAALVCHGPILPELAPERAMPRPKTGHRVRSAQRTRMENPSVHIMSHPSSETVSEPHGGVQCSSSARTRGRRAC
ncbi:hypothetical protein CZ774_09880 [Frigoribacterium sp. JB110]|nr:hypothetical protein CZ774_09880 [Frigoribacterium sp. JB110]